MTVGETHGYGGALAYQMPPEGQIELDGEALMLKLGAAYHLKSATPFAPKSSQGDPSYGDMMPYESPSAQANWAAGYGYLRASHTLSSDGWSGSYWAAYLEGLNVDASMPGRIILSPPTVFESLPGLVSSSTPVRLAELGGTLLCAAGTALYRRNDQTQAWTVANGTAFPAPATDLGVLGGTAFVALGDLNNMVYTSDLSAFGTTAPATFLTTDKVGLYRSFSINCVQGSTSGIGWSTEPVLVVGDTSAPITGLSSGGGLVLLWAGKTDGLWGIPSGAAGTATKYLPFDRRYARNGRNMMWHGPLLLVPNGRGLWTFQASSQTTGEAANITPARDAQQLGRVRGEVRALADSLRYVYAALVDTTFTPPMSFINKMDTRSGKWHTWVFPGQQRIETMFSRATDTQGGPPALWFGFGNQIGRISLPITSDDPLSDPACFPPEVRVRSDSSIVSIGHRPWTGELVKIATDGGHQLSGTPNHPVLTNRGWVALDALMEGDYVVGSCLDQKLALANADEDDADPSIGEVFELAALFGAHVRLRAGGKEQFHGDGQDGDVHVVTIDSQLQDRLEAALAQPVGEYPLSLADKQPRLLAHQRAAAQLILRARTHRGQVPLPGPLAAPVRPSGFPQHVIGGALIADRHAGALQATMHRADPYTLAPGNRQRRFTGQVAADDVIHVQGDALASGVHTSLLEPVHDDPGVHPEISPNGRGTFASPVAQHKVVSIQRVGFSGQVFNLQTESGSYSANDLTVHNSRYTTATDNVELISSTFDFNLPDAQKALLWIQFGAERLQGSMKYCDVDYQLDSDGTWHTDLNPRRAVASPSTQMFFPRNTAHCRWIQLRIRPRTADVTDTPIVRFVVIHARVLIENRWRWTLTVSVAQNQQLANYAQREDYAFRIYRKLLRLREDQDIIVFRDREGYEWNVLLDAVDATLMRESGGVQPEYSVSMELTQALPGLAEGTGNAIEIPTPTDGASVLEAESYLEEA